MKCNCYPCWIREHFPELAPTCLHLDEWERDPTELGGWEVEPPAYVSIERGEA